MFGYEIEDVLESNFITAKIFKGVYSANNLPKFKKTMSYPAAFIANTHENYKQGEHWVAFFFKSKKSLPEYFDSYGLPPLKRSFYSFLKQQKKDLKYQYNKKVLQSVMSNVCGQYTIYYIFQKCKGKSLRRILKDFSDKSEINDLCVKEFVEKLQKKMKVRRRYLNMLKPKFAFDSKCQCSKSRCCLY